MGADLNLLVQQRQAKIESLQQQQQAVSDQLAQINGNASSVEVQLGDRRVSLERAVVELSNFTIPCTMDEPDRATFTRIKTEQDEEGNERQVEEFDQAAFDAEYAKYEESVRVAEEAERKKAELEDAVRTATGEVTGYENDLNQLLQAAQAKEDELVATNEAYNVSMSELEDLNEQIRVAEQQEAAAPPEPEVKVVKGTDGLTRTYEIDPETGKPTKLTVTDENGTVVQSKKFDSENPSITYLQERSGDLTIDSVAEDGRITSKFATSDAGNVAEYDGHGNTKIIVKAGESPDLIYKTFYGGGEDNAQNHENLVNQFRKKVIMNGEPVPADYNPSEAQLKAFFYRITGFGSDGKDLKTGKLIQAGQTMKIPTEIHPDNKNLQGRIADDEKRIGNEAERKRQDQSNAADAVTLLNNIEQQVERRNEEIFLHALITEIRHNAGIYDNVSQEVAQQGGGHPTATKTEKYFDNQFDEHISYITDGSSFDNIAYQLRYATGGQRFATGESSTSGRSSINVTGDDLRNLYGDMKLLAILPEGSDEYNALAQKVNRKWNYYTARDYTADVMSSRAENRAIVRTGVEIMKSLAIDAFLTALPGGKEIAGVAKITGAGTKMFIHTTDAVLGYTESTTVSAIQGNDMETALMDGFVGLIPCADAFRKAFKPQTLTTVYKQLGNSAERMQSLANGLASMSEYRLELLLKYTEGKSESQKAAILVEFARRYL